MNLPDRTVVTPGSDNLRRDEGVGVHLVRAIALPSAPGLASRAHDERGIAA
jgi:hypothetical protein